MVFWGLTTNKADIKAGDDAAEAQWFNINNLPPLAFDHEEIIQRFKNEYPDFSN